MSASNPGDEFTVRIPKVVSSKTKRVSILKFNNGLNVDVAQWTTNNVSMSREDNEATYVPAESLPKSGVGSEFGRQAREDARRKKLGYATAKYSQHDQPWILNLKDTAAPNQSKKFRGIKEGGISQNADYWVFVRAGDGVFDAYPVDDWYNFMPMARYKTLDADEAEERFSKRNQILNQFALKIQQKLEGNEDTSASGSVNQKKRNGDDEDVKKPKKTDSDDDTDVKPTKANIKRKPRKRKKKKEGEEDEDFIASAESDDGDEEGREVDYMSDTDMSSSSEAEPEDVKVREALIGVDEEEGIKRTILEDEDEQEADEEEEEDDESKKRFDRVIKQETIPTVGADADERASDSGSDSDDPDEEDVKSPLFMKDIKPVQQDADLSSGPISTGEGTSAMETSSNGKRKINDEPASLNVKKTKTEKSETSGISEDEVRRYLQRKPQSSKDLVAKFKPKCQGMSKSEVVKCLAEILKKLSPEQSERNGTMYFSLKK